MPLPCFIYGGAKCAGHGSFIGKFDFRVVKREQEFIERMFNKLL